MFDNKELFKLAIRKKCMVEGVQYMTNIPTKERFGVVCFVKKCYCFVISKAIKSTSVFQVTKIIGQHTCSATELQRQQKSVRPLYR